MVEIEGDNGAVRARRVCEGFGPVVLCALGCVGSMTWLPAVGVIADSYRAGALALADLAPLLVAFLAAFGASAMGAALIRARGRWGRGLGVMAVALLGALVGSVLLFLPLTGPGAAIAALRGLAGALLGLSGGAASVAWGVRFEGLAPARRCAASFAVTAIACLLAAFAQWRGVDALLLLAVGAASALSFALFALSALRGEDALDLPARPLSGLGRAYGRIAGSYFLFGLVFSMMIMQFLIAQHGRALSWTWLLGLGGIAVAGLAVAVGRAVSRSQWNWLSVMRFAAVPVIVAFYPFDAGTEFSLWFAMGASAVALWAYLSLVAGIAGDAAACLHAPFALVWGTALASLAVGAVVGTALAQLIEAFGAQTHITVTAIVAMVCAVLASDVVLTRGSLARAYRRAVAAAGAREGEAPAADPSLGERIAAVAEACALTDREAEVLGILARGHGLSRVQEALYIAEGTAITHRRHIYQKLDVHSKAELIDFVATFGDEGVDDD